MTTSSWKLESQASDLSGLVFSTTEGPSEKQLKENEILVELKAASLNYRDLMIARGNLNLPFVPGVILGSDGAGVVLATGASVSGFQPGDRVVTHLVPSEFPSHYPPEVYPLSSSSFPHLGHVDGGLGQELNGTLTTQGVFHESNLVKLGDRIPFEQAATLTCSGLTAWNALMGLEGRQVKRGDWVLVQGTGGVSTAALQFAVAAGATVIATTSSDAKAARLKELGAQHVINYREDAQWGSTARNLTPEGRGIDIAVDVGGNTTLGESLKAVKVTGLVVVAGMVGGLSDKPEPIMSILGRVCVVRGIILGAKDMMTDIIQFVDDHDIELALDDQVFALKDMLGALKRLEEQKHFAKVVIQIPGN